jgi:hypothetical protein
MFNELFDDNPFTFNIDDPEHRREVVRITLDALSDTSEHNMDAAEEKCQEVFDRGPDAVYVSCMAIAGASKKFILLAQGMDEMPPGAFTVVLPPVRESEDEDDVLARRFAAQFTAAYMNDDTATCTALFGAVMATVDAQKVCEAHVALMEQAHLLMHKAHEANPFKFSAN